MEDVFECAVLLLVFVKAAELQNKMLQAQKEAQIELDEKLAVVSSKLEGEKTTLLQDNDELKGEMEKVSQVNTIIQIIRT